MYIKKIENVKTSKAGEVLSYEITVTKETPSEYKLKKIGCNKRGFIFHVTGAYKKPNGRVIYNTTFQYFASINEAIIAAAKISKRIIKKHGK